MKKKAKKKSAVKKTTSTNDQHPLLTRLSESQLLDNSEDDVFFYKRDPEDERIRFIAPIKKTEFQESYWNDQAADISVTSVFKQRFILDDPNLLFYLIHFGVNNKHIEKIIQTYSIFYPDANHIVAQTIVLDDTFELEHQFDPTGQIQKKLQMAQLIFLGHTPLIYSVLRNNHLVMMTLLKNGANANQVRACHDEQKLKFLSTKRSTIIKQINTITCDASKFLTSHISINNKQDTIAIKPKQLSVVLQHDGEEKIFNQCKLFFHIHANTFTLSGFAKLASGELDVNPQNLMQLDPGIIQSISSDGITLDNRLSIDVFLRLGHLGLHWHNRSSPLYLACQNENLLAIKTLIMYEADAFYSPHPNVLTPWDYMMKTKQYSLFQAFHPHAKYFDSHQEKSLISESFKAGEFRIALGIIALNPNWVDSDTLVKQYPAHVAAMISQQTTEKDVFWIDYITKTSDDASKQISTIMADANLSALFEGWLFNADLMVALWKQYPPTESLLNEFTKWCIDNKNTIVVEAILVKMQQTLTLPYSDNYHSQLLTCYPDQVTFKCGADVTIPGQTEILIDRPPMTNKHIDNVRNEIQTWRRLSNDLIDDISWEKSKKISYTAWFQIEHDNRVIKKQLKILSNLEEDIVTNFDNILESLVYLQESYKNLKEMAPKKNHSDISILNGDLEKDLLESHLDQISLFEALPTNDHYALYVQKEINQFRHELITSMMCDKSFFIRQFFLLLKGPNRHTTSNIDPEYRAKHLSNLSALITLATYYTDRLKMQQKKSYCNRICDWIFNEKKGSSEIISWTNTFLFDLLKDCDINPKNNISLQTTIDINIKNRPLGEFIKKSIDILNSLISVKSDLALSQNQKKLSTPIERKAFAENNLLNLKKVIIYMNDLTAITPYYLYNENIKANCGDDYNVLKFVLNGLQFTHQGNINHTLIPLKDCDIYRCPQFLISLFDALDNLRPLLENLNDKLSLSFK